MAAEGRNAASRFLAVANRGRNGGSRRSCIGSGPGGLRYAGHRGCLHAAPYPGSARGGLPHRENVGITIVASGPLTSDALSFEIGRLTSGGDPDDGNSSHLFFYDSISPIVDAESIDRSKVYLAARYDKGSADYINCPMTKEEYDCFYDALVSAHAVEGHDWENLNYFESCLPIEEIARRGRDTLRFGPMKPVGLIDPRNGKRPYAVVQLRQENLRADSYNLVGFQNHLRFPEQARVFRLIPGLENASFLRYGQIHRNTYINSPALLQPTLQLNASQCSLCRPDLRCGRLCRVDCRRSACRGASLLAGAGS